MSESGKPVSEHTALGDEPMIVVKRLSGVGICVEIETSLYYGKIHLLKSAHKLRGIVLLILVFCECVSVKLGIIYHGNYLLVSLRKQRGDLIP